jgi:GNAT superfamily N-acetyltransferase
VAYRGMGCAKRVLSFAVGEAWAADCYTVMLLTGSKDPTTHAFYRACGFDGDEKTAYIVRADI